MTHYGFNFQWMLVHEGSRPEPPNVRALDFMARHGFNFVRVPTNYRVWTTDFESLDRYLVACSERGIHLSLNLHRAPGYCITRNDLERHNLWADREAQDAFVFLWELFATRFCGISGEALSFDLLNEPPEIGQFGFSRDIHEALIRRTVTAVRAVDPSRPIVIDGLDGGNLAMPELGDLDVTQSGRGYAPYPISHWGAEWWAGWKEGDAPRYPGVLYRGRNWDKSDIRKFYEPWLEVERMGRPIHIGEFGCYNQTPNADALRWLGDLMGLYREFGWGYAMWNFEGPFGIVGHGRAGARIQNMDGYDVDLDLLDLMLSSRVDGPAVRPENREPASDAR